MRQCHYEVLGVEREASNSGIRKAYMKLALQWHPDKNHDNVEEATKKFTIIQEAYEVLSDPNERAWYDNHRESILRGDEGKDAAEEGYIPDLMKFFSASCFKGYGDDDKGFYAAYRNAFETIIQTEKKFAEDPSVKEMYPGFGNSKTSYEEIKAFYNFWNNFSSKMTFGWKEQYNLNDAPNRQVRRAMEKENKKNKDTAKKEFNETVRKLAGFAKKRDKRFEEYEINRKQEEASRKAEEEKKRLQKEKEKKQAQVKAAQNYKAPSWAQVDEERMKQLDDLYSHGPEADEEEEFICMACNKKFKSEKQWQNHEKSKKHIETMALLEAELGDSDPETWVVEDADDGEEKDNKDENNEEEEDIEQEDEVEPAEEEENEEVIDGKEEANHDEEVINVEETDETDETGAQQKEDNNAEDSEQIEEEMIAAMEEVSLGDSQKAGKKKKNKKKQNWGAELDENQIELVEQEEVTPIQEDLPKSDSDEEWDDRKKGKKGKKKGKKVETSSSNIKEQSTPVIQSKPVPEKQIQEEEFRCQICNEEFPTRNRLFGHINKTGHAIPLSSKTPSVNPENGWEDEPDSKKKGKKRK